MVQGTSKDPMSTLSGRKCPTSPDVKMRSSSGTIVASNYDHPAAAVAVVVFASDDKKGTRKHFKPIWDVDVLREEIVGY